MWRLSEMSPWEFDFKNKSDRLNPVKLMFLKMNWEILGCFSTSLGES